MVSRDDFIRRRNEIAQENDEAVRFRKYACLFKLLLNSIYNDEDAAQDLKGWGLEWTRGLMQEIRPATEVVDDALQIDAQLIQKDITYKLNTASSTDDLLTPDDIQDIVARRIQALKIEIDSDARIRINPVLMAGAAQFRLRSARVGDSSYNCNDQNQWNDDLDCGIAPVTYASRGAVLYYNKS